MAAHLIGAVGKLDFKNKPLHKFVLLALCNFANSDDEAWPSYPTIAKFCSISEASAKRSIKYLEKNGYITKTKCTHANGRSTSNFYKINIEITVKIKGEKTGGEGICQTPQRVSNRHPSKENPHKDPSSLNKHIKISTDLKGKKPPAKNIFLTKKKENKNMAVNYACDVSQKCQFVHQSKEFGDSGYCCTNTAQTKVKVKDETGKKFDFDVCPRHERMISSRKTFKYFKNVLTMDE